MKKISVMNRIVLIAVSVLLFAGCSPKQGSFVKPENYSTMNQEGMQKVGDFIKSCGHYFIATIDGDQPRVRPFGTINIFEGKLYIQTGHIKKVSKQIDCNGKVELCAFNGQDWIRLSGKLVEDPRVEAKVSMLEAYPELRSMYDPTDGNTAVYFFTDACAEICSFVKEKETIFF